METMVEWNAEGGSLKMVEWRQGFSGTQGGKFKQKK